MRINYDLEDIRAFCCVARMGQYTSAAALLCVTTSALSRRITKLESEIGGKLFERTTRIVVLTSVGRALYERVLPIVTQMDATLTEAARRARGHEGTLMLSTVASVGYSVLPNVLPDFYARHPQVYLSIRDGNATVTTGLVEDREVEFGITTPVSFSPTLEAERIATYGFNMVYAERSRLAPRTRKLSWQKLLGLPVVGLNPLSSTRLQIDSVLNARGLDLPWTIEVDQLATMIGLVQSGNFVTIMPGLFEAHGYGLKSIPVHDPDITRDVYIVRRRDSTPTPQGQYLMELVRAYLAHQARA